MEGIKMNQEMQCVNAWIDQEDRIHMLLRETRYLEKRLDILFVEIMFTAQGVVQVYYPITVEEA